jgi:hypothetical protein
MQLAAFHVREDFVVHGGGSLLDWVTGRVAEILRGTEANARPDATNGREQATSR